MSVPVIDGTQTFKVSCKVTGKELSHSVYCAPDEGTVEERLQAAIAEFGADAVLYNYTIGAKTSARNRLYSYKNGLDEDQELTEEMIVAHMADWKPSVGQRGGPRKSAKEKLLGGISDLGKDELSELLAALEDKIREGAGE
jgi:hypothetical protein